MQQFRAFIKSRTDLGGNAITNAGMQVVSFNITRDLLTGATSNIQLLQTPQAIAEGDVLGIYGTNGQVIYNGIITSLSDNIQCSQMASLFSDEYLNIPYVSSNAIETDLLKVLKSGTAESTDALLKEEFKPFVFSATSTTQGKLMQEEPYSVSNYEELIYNAFNIYDVIADIKVPFEPVPPTIEIGKCKKVPIQLGTNAISVLSVIPTTTASEVNKLVVYTQGDDVTAPTHRATYYLTANGITENMNDLSRIPRIKTRYIFSDDDLEVIKNGNLQSRLYSHEITCELALDSKLYDFWSFKLGQRFNIFAKGIYYETVLTGYTLNFNDHTMPSVILKFGKVRVNLESKLFKLFKG